MGASAPFFTFMTNRARLSKVRNAIRNGRLVIPKGGREGDWYGYWIRIEEWTWERNRINGFGVDVHYPGRSGNYIGSIKIDLDLGKTSYENY